MAKADTSKIICEKKEDNNNKIELNNSPGSGWTNGDIPTLLTPHTQNGRITLYGKHRRWINYKSSWSRISHDLSSTDKVHSESHSGTVRVFADTEEEAETMKCLIAQLCEHFFRVGWATGTGGGVSIRIGGPEDDRPWRVFVAPSGLQKEDMIGEDVFELDMDGKIVNPPVTPNLKLSACTPLWYVVYRHRPKVRCVIHTHSMHALLATLLDPSEESDVLRVTHLEMLKGVGGHAYDDVLEIPIIDNRPTEDLLSEQLERVIAKYPKTNAVLVRRHGLYVWGDSWEQAKTHCESFDYIFDSCIKMRSIGMDFSSKPIKGTYGEGSKKRPLKEVVLEADRNIKRIKTADGTAASGFHGKEAYVNTKDLLAVSLPLIPLHGKVLLLDIEGCTTSISFVKDTLFPYILKHLDNYVDTEMDQSQVDTAYTALQADVQALKDASLKQKCLIFPSTLCHRSAIKQIVNLLMSNDIKATGLKALQGNMWKSGYHSRSILAHVYPDFVPLLEWCSSHSIQVNIYSSGSINAQKLLFGNTSSGDLTSHFHQYFDTTSGSKIESTSYTNIASKLDVPIENIIFVSDAEKELVAARKAGMKHVVMSVRPGNAPMTEVGEGFPKVYSLLQLCGA